MGIPSVKIFLTENVDIINRLCKEVEKLMHLLQGVKSEGTEPFALLDHHGGGRELLSNTPQTSTSTHAKLLLINNALIKCLPMCVCLDGT